MGTKDTSACGSQPQALRPVWAGQVLTPEDATDHFLAVGAAGSGKSVLLRALMGSVLTESSHGPRALVYDPRGTFDAALANLVDRQQLVRLDPTDERGWAWDIAADVTTEAEADLVATALLLPTAGGVTSFFTDAARHLLTEVLLALQGRVPTCWSLRDVLLACSDLSSLRALLGGTERGQAACASYLSSAPTVQEVLAKATAAYHPVAAGWDGATQRLSLRAWVPGNSVLLLADDTRLGEPLRVVNRMLFDQAARLLLASESPLPTWVFLDDVGRLGCSEWLLPLLESGRAKAVSVALSLQTVEELEACYGESTAAELLDQCRNVAWLRPDTPRSLDWAVDAISALLGPEASRLDKLARELASLPDGKVAGWFAICSSPPRYGELARHDVLDGPAAAPAAGYRRRPACDVPLRPWDLGDRERLGLDQP